MTPDTIDDVLHRVEPARGYVPLPAPFYDRPLAKPYRAVMMAVASMARHTADAGWQLTLGLEHGGYSLWGYELPNEETDTKAIIRAANPTSLVLQDKREWEGRTASNLAERDLMAFRNVHVLQDRPDIFKTTVLKDAQQRPTYHEASAAEIGAHAWIIYYHPRIVAHVAPYVRTEHCVRVYHSVNTDDVPRYRPDRTKGTLISGAVSDAYPLRRRLVANADRLGIRYTKHPGYHAKGCMTPQYLMQLAKYKVAICTASRFGYALRKIIEATACGCRVLTTLPVDDVLPYINENLYRVPMNSTSRDVAELAHELEHTYDPAFQRRLAALACQYYDYRAQGMLLAMRLEQLRVRYDADATTDCPRAVS